MDEHPIQGLMTTAMENLQKIVEINTIVGEPIKSPDGKLIIPVSKLGVGFAAGGSEFNVQGKGDSETPLPFGGGSGGGVSLTPVAFLIITDKEIKMVHMDQKKKQVNELTELLPQLLEKLEKMAKTSSGEKKGKDNDKDSSKNKKDENEEGGEKKSPSKYDI